MTLRHVVSTSQLTKENVRNLISRAEYLRIQPRPDLRGRLSGSVVATLFYEPSTRTRLSFEVAVARLGGRVVGAENALENSSARKGESLEDVFRVVGSYVDAIVIRHHKPDAMAKAAPYSPVPIINAGAGCGEHPTQGLLDIYTLWREFGRVDDLNVAVIGDLKYGRTVHSLLKLLALFDGVSVTLVHPPSLGLPDELAHALSDAGLNMQVSSDFVDVLQKADCVYQTRLQTERMAEAEVTANPSPYRITRRHLEMMKPQARILHPLPRRDEIPADIDTDIRAAYFRQAENGLYLRMALLDHLLGGTKR